MKILKKFGLFVLAGATALGVGLSLGSGAKDVSAADQLYYTWNYNDSILGSFTNGYSVVQSFSTTDTSVTPNVTISWGGYCVAKQTSYIRLGGKTIQSNLHATNYSGYVQTASASSVNISKIELAYYAKDSSIVSLSLGVKTGAYNTAQNNPTDVTYSDYVTKLAATLPTVQGNIVTFTPSTGSYWASGSSFRFVMQKTSNSSNAGFDFTQLKIYKYSSAVATGVTIPSELSVTRGTPQVITPTFSPEGSSSPLTWTSTNESVATVSNGVVTGLSAGTSTIRAAISEEVYDECLVTVSIPATTSISVSLSTLYMGVGASKSKTLTVTSLPVGSDNGVTWLSDDDGVATVSDGVVTGVTDGDTILIVTSTANPSLVVYVTVYVYSNFYEMGHSGTATSDSGTTLTTGDIASNAAGHLTGDASSMSYTTVTSIYPAAGKLKTGTTTVNGVLAFNLPSGNNATKLIISAQQYGTDTTTIAVNGGTAQTVASGTAFNEYIFDVTASNSVEIVFAKRAYFNSISIIYSVPTFGTLDSIAINTPASDLTFEVGETFSSAGLTLTATDTLSRTMAVNDGFTTNYDSHVFVPGDVGTVSVTVSYTHGAVTKTTSYNITVLAAAVYYHDFVDAEAIEFSYVSSSANVTSTSEYKLMSGLAWNMVYTPQDGKLVSIGNYNGITFGSGTHPFETVQIKSGLVSIGGANKITKVIVDISGNGSTAVGTVTVDVGGTALDYTDNAYAGAPASREQMVFTSSTGLFGHVNIVIHGTTAGAGLYGIKIFADADTTDTGLANNFAAAVEATDSCGVSAEENVSSLRAQYNALSSTAKSALSSINIYDFAAGDNEHTGIQSVTYTAANKWAMLDAMYPEVPGSNLVVNQYESTSIYSIVLLAIGGITIIGGMFFLKRKREE